MPVRKDSASASSSSNTFPNTFEEKREQLLFGFSDPKSEWFIKEEPQRAEVAENREFSLSARATPC